MTDPWQQIHRNAQREIGSRAAAIGRQPWRIWRNRRLRGEVRAIMAVVDPEWSPRREYSQTRTAPGRKKTHDRDAC